MDVSIIIVNYNTLSLVKACIDSIISKTKDIKYEIIVVDNASNDGSKEFFSNDKRIIYIYNKENLGFGLANNEGIKIASGRNIFLLNPDTLLINNAIKILSEFLDGNPDAGCCGGNLYNNKMKPTHSYTMTLPSFFWEINLLFCGKLEKLIWGRNSQFNHTNKKRKVGYICGADMMIKHCVLDEIGLFSDKIFLYYEDTELSYRIKKAGYNIFSLPEAEIQHLEGESMGDKQFNKKRMKFIETSLSIYYSLHFSGLKRNILNTLRLMRLEIKYRFLYRNKFNDEFYKECKTIIKANVCTKEK